MNRKEQHEYEADVVYEVWRRGGNVDAIDYDEIFQDMHDCSPEEAANKQMTHKKRTIRSWDI